MRRRHAPSDSGRALFEEGHTSQRPCSLGQLGRLLGDGPRTPPRRRDVVGHHLEGGATTPRLRKIRQVAHDLLEVGFEPLSWRALLAGARPERNEVDEFEWGCGIGWQHEAASRVERHHREPCCCHKEAQEAVCCCHKEAQEAVWLSQLAPRAASREWARNTSVSSSSPSTPSPFDRAFLHGVAAHSIFMAITAQFAHGLGSWGGVSRCRVWWRASVENSCGRVSTNVLVRDLEFHLPNAADGRRLEVAVLMGCSCSEEPNQRWIPHW